MKRCLFAALAVGVLALAGCLVYAAFFAPSGLDDPELDPALLYSEQLNATAVSSLGDAVFFDELEREVLDSVVQGIVSQGSTVGGLLQEWLSPDQLHSFVNASNPIFPLRSIRAGQPFSVTHTNGVLSRFEYEIDDERRLVVCKEADTFNAVIENIEYDVLLDKVEGTIESSLFESMAALGEMPLLAVDLADIFAWEINFIRDVQPGDHFKVLVEKRFRDGDFKGYGNLLAAEFTSKGKTFEAFSYCAAPNRLVYFNAKGESLRRAFLKAPLSFTRISSRFTPRRFHPILKTWRAHPAVDYAAPTGTPVKAIGNGLVIFSGWGTGAGNYITLKHHGGFESMYLHLSGFAKGLKKGKKVMQGEVIGFVGSTGYSTGPHLDFRMKKNGQFINPEANLSPRAEPLAPQHLAQFKVRSGLLRRYMSGEKSLTDYADEKGSLDL